MAITKTYIGTDNNKWQSFLSETGIFSSVGLEDSVFTCKDSNNNTVLTINHSATNTWSFAVSLATGDTYTKTYAIQGGSAGENYGVKCSNGALLYMNGSSGYISVLLTKNNKNEPVVVLPSSTSARNPIACLCRSDTYPVSTFTLSSVSANQTVLSKFITSAAEGDVSYTPNAYYMPFGQYIGVGLAKFTMNSKRYVTDGYWVLLDGDAD